MSAVDEGIFVARHSRVTAANTRCLPLSFVPRHCAGGSCMHNHAGASVPLPPVRNVRSIVRQAARVVGVRYSSGSVA